MKKKPELQNTVPGVPVGEFVEEFLTKPTFDQDGVQATSGIGLDGREYPDPTPMSPPVGLRPPEDLMTTIRRMVHHEAFTRAMDELGFDTFEEAGDYDVIEDGDFMDELTPYEAVFYPPDEGKAAPEPSKSEPAANPPASPANPPSKSSEKPTPQTSTST